MSINAFKYYLGIVPGGYSCKKCGVQGCKLWRESHTYNIPVAPMCCDCISNLKKVDINQINNNGQVPFHLAGMWIDQFGGCVPAVPSEDGSGFYGYGSIPQAGANWWYNLPNRI